MNIIFIYYVLAICEGIKLFMISWKIHCEIYFWNNKTNKTDVLSYPSMFLVQLINFTYGINWN